MKRYLKSRPILFFVSTIALIVIADVVVMAFVRNLALPVPVKILIDSLLITLILAPVVYVLYLRPLLKSSERQYEQLLENAPDPMLILSLTGTIKTFNKAAEKVSGYSAEELIGKHFEKVDLLAPEYLSLAGKEFKNIIYGDISRPYEIEIIPKNGGRLQFEVHARMISHLGNILVVFRDISSRKKSEKDLLASEERYRTLSESARDAIYLIDREYRLQYLNSYGASMFQSAQENLIGMPIQDLFPKNW